MFTHCCGHATIVARQQPLLESIEPRPAPPPGVDFGIPRLGRPQPQGDSIESLLDAGSSSSLGQTEFGNIGENRVVRSSTSVLIAFCLRWVAAAAQRCAAIQPSRRAAGGSCGRHLVRGLHLAEAAHASAARFKGVLCDSFIGVLCDCGATCERISTSEWCVAPASIDTPRCSEGKYGVRSERCDAARDMDRAASVRGRRISCRRGHAYTLGCTAPGCAHLPS